MDHPSETDTEPAMAISEAEAVNDTTTKDAVDAVVTVTPSKKESTSSQSQQEHVFSPELLKLYYARLFPYSLLGDWLSYTIMSDDGTTRSKTSQQQPFSSKVFSRREFSFTLEPIPGEEIYIRYQSFNNIQELEKAIQRRQPHKIDIGAVFTHPPKDKQAYDPKLFHPVQRELVFDIDLTDYDDIRHCGCTGAKICPKCWTYMTMAVQVMDQGLKEDFGFDHVAWFYSGRRGVHAWICDEEARMLSNEARSAVANYFEVSVGKKNSESLLSSSSSSVHPMLERAYDVLEPYFCRDVLPADGHGLLATQELWEPLLDSLPAAARDTVGANLKKKWAASVGTSKELSPVDKWKQLLQHLRVKFGLQDENQNDGDANNHASNNKRPKLSTSVSETNKEKHRIAVWPMEVVFLHTYPRLDINVSKMQNHLLKSPFCVHPKTGRVCVPIHVPTVDSFDPFAVPTLNQLARELDEYHAAAAATGTGTSDDKVEYEWQKTSLKSYFEGFRKDFLRPMQKEWRQKERDQAEQDAAMRGDF
ncbi:DNA primase small subunit [Nitzschia inconspicua]|uniref:DNA primase n=1 Tax=Nitzschia inconspicua TaxID=303405 RepID=A0A9K3L619_9STRA|nr:DNA primase small subunit [Nitzschia inconspicua]